MTDRRTVKSPAERAQESFDRAQRVLDKARARLAKAAAECDQAQADVDTLTKRRDYLALDPALQAAEILDES